MVTISSIVQGGIAESLDIAPGDSIISVNAEPVHDFLDVLIAERLDDVVLVVQKTNGDLWELDIEKEADAPFGFSLEHPDPKHCGNNCIFCFVHQLPKGLRRTLYVKDEDYRFSYLYGSYITLSNLNESDIDRIIRLRLTPLYVSVHAIDERLRSDLLGRNVRPVLPVLERLTENGIEIHAQIVVCPGINDGDALDETVTGLQALYPGVKSLALVPVGLTRHRQDQPSLVPVSGKGANRILEKLVAWQHAFLSASGSRFVFAADEIYLRAGVDFPSLEAYEDLAQIENGVGLIALFRFEAKEVFAEAEEVDCPLEFSVVTGHAFRDELQKFLARLAELTGCHPLLYSIDNRLFGSTVTVAGLVSGADIAAQLSGKNLGSVLFVPDVMMRDGAETFLDDMTPDQLAEKLGCRVLVVPADPWGVFEAIEELSSRSNKPE